MTNKILWGILAVMFLIGIYGKTAEGAYLENGKIIMSEKEFNTMVTDLKSYENEIKILKEKEKFKDKQINFLNEKLSSLDYLQMNNEENYKAMLKNLEENFNLQLKQTDYWKNKYDVQKSFNPLRNGIYFLLGGLAGYAIGN